MEKSQDIFSTILSIFDTNKFNKENAYSMVKQIRRYIVDEAHRYEIKGALDSMKLLGIEEYQYICEDKYDSCSTCRKLAKEGPYKLAKAEEGKNLPPIHPNCKCTVGSFIDNDKLQELQQGQEKDKVSNDDEEKIKLEDFLTREKQNFITPLYVGKLLNNLYSNNYINSNGEKYKYNPNVSKNIAIVDDKILNYNNLTKEEKEIFNLLKQRDECRSTAERENILKKAYDLMMKYNASGKKLSFDFFQSYDYYKVGRDVTKEIYDIIKKYESLLYVYSKIFWTSSLYPFYRLVRGKAVLDLKNRAQFKTNSTYIFEGEIVDADALGNIVYGYIGKYLGIPSWVLLSGGGYAQTVAGTASEEFYEYNFDDPKDQYRILQGMVTFNRNNIELPVGVPSVNSNLNNQYKI